MNVVKEKLLEEKGLTLPVGLGVFKFMQLRHMDSVSFSNVDVLLMVSVQDLSMLKSERSRSPILQME